MLPYILKEEILSAISMAWNVRFHPGVKLKLWQLSGEIDPALRWETLGSDLIVTSN